jgi:glycosyltransferase involved in cell wall biosynthesis
VIDGGSTDETKQVVEQYREVVTHFVSGKDRGQADAINKGFRLAKGDILAWLNSDDMYLPCVLEKVARALADPAAPALVHGGCLAFWEGRPRAQAWLPEETNSEKLQTRACIFQPSAFWTRALWEQTGELNTDCHFVLDWDWFLRASRHVPFNTLPELLSLYRFHAGHKTSGGHARRTQEIIELVEREAGPAWGAAFRDVAAQLDDFTASLDRLRRWRLYGLRTLIHRDLYGRHGAKVKVALSQLHVRV